MVLTATRPACEALGLYVHVPFCEVKCAYCHFAIDPGRPAAARQERYLQALLTEIAAAEAGPADSVYFGGGTPSLFGVERLGRVLEALRQRFDLAADAEITVEANPRDLTADDHAVLRAHGVERLSVGVQAFDDGVLRAMGRLHTAAEARTAVQAARAAGYRSVSLDLLLGWPGESVARWRAGLDAALALEVDHLSLYILEVEGRTLLVHRARRGQVELPDDDLVADLYALTLEHLASAGLARYEISNFARPGHASRHNGKYWDDAPFLGFGLSAHSFRHGRRWWNQASFGAYTRALERGGAAAARAGERVPTEAQRVGEALFTGLRRVEGVELPAFRARFGVDPLERYAASLRDAFAAGLLEVVGQRLRLTTRGVLLSNEVFQSFVELPAVTRPDHANAGRPRA